MEFNAETVSCNHKFGPKNAKFQIAQKCQNCNSLKNAKTASNIRNYVLKNAKTASSIRSCVIKNAKTTSPNCGLRNSETTPAIAFLKMAFNAESVSRIRNCVL